MKCLVTGAAGFIGSHLAERLLDEGYQVLGVDCFSDYYARKAKEANLADLYGRPGFELLEANLLDLDLPALLEGVDCIFHEAGQAGVRASWGRHFEAYTLNNVIATQRLLEATRGSSLSRFIYASSSSVYGDAESYPTREDMVPRPVSPYGVTKLAGEHLCYLYWKSFGVPTVSLRYFTVYGPRQRPDMAFHRFIQSMLNDRPLAVYGDGEQSRDFTFVGDVVEANLRALKAECVGQVLNIGGGSRVTLRQAIETLEGVLGRQAKLELRPVQAGDVRHTAADISRAQESLGYRPRIGLPDGLRKEVEWIERAGYRG